MRSAFNKMNILYLLLAIVLRPGESNKCYSPAFHYEIPQKLQWGLTFSLYNGDEDLLYLIYSTEDKYSPAIRIVVTDNLLSWKCRGDLSGIIPAGFSALYVTYDDCGSSNTFKYDGGTIFAVHDNETYGVYNYENSINSYSEICNPCSTYSVLGSPLNWLTPVRDNKRGLWVSMNYTHILLSKHLVYWKPSIPLRDGLINSDDDNIFVEELFTLAHPDTGDAQWIAAVRHYEEFQTLYYFIELTEDELKVDTDITRILDYGPDLQELAVANTYNYAPDEVLLLASISNLYANDSSKDFYPCWTLSTAYIRTLSLSVLNGVLRLKIYPIEAFVPKQIIKNVFFRDTTFDSKTDLLKRFKGDVFQLSVDMSSPDASKFGISFFANDKQASYIYYSLSDKAVGVDRSESILPNTTNPNGKIYYSKGDNLSPDFLKLTSMALDIFVDRSIVEVFDKRGWFTITTVIYHDKTAREIHTFTKDKPVNVKEITLQLIQTY